MRLISWNVNGIRAAEKKGFLEWFNSEKPDILGIQETKAHQEQLSSELLNVPGYNSYFCSGERKGYSGTAIYSKTEPISILRGFGIEKFDNEGRILIAEYPGFLLYNIYFPNGSSKAERLTYKMEFYDAFFEHVNSQLKAGKKIIVCGDVNTAHKEIDLALPDANRNKSGFLDIEREWIDKFLTLGFIDTFRVFNSEGGNYTWWEQVTRARSRNEGWRIDYFLISNNLSSNLKDAFIMPNVQGSDHCPVGIELIF